MTITLETLCGSHRNGLDDASTVENGLALAPGEAQRADSADFDVRIGSGIRKCCSALRKGFQKTAFARELPPPAGRAAGLGSSGGLSGHSFLFGSVR